MDSTTTTSVTPQAALTRREAAHTWYGYVALDSIGHVFDRMKRMLDGRTYTWVSYNTTQPNSFPEVRTGQHLQPTRAIDSEGLRLLDYSETHRGISAVDTYGVWGVSTTVATEAEAAEMWRTPETRQRHKTAYVHIIGDRGRAESPRIEIAQTNGYDEVLHWTIALEAVQS